MLGEGPRHGQEALRPLAHGNCRVKSELNDSHFVCSPTGGVAGRSLRLLPSSQKPQDILGLVGVPWGSKLGSAAGGAAERRAPPPRPRVAVAVPAPAAGAAPREEDETSRSSEPSSPSRILREQQPDVLVVADTPSQPLRHAFEGAPAPKVPRVRPAASSDAAGEPASSAEGSPMGFAAMSPSAWRKVRTGLWRQLEEGLIPRVWGSRRVYAMWTLAHPSRQLGARRIWTRWRWRS